MIAYDPNNWFRLTFALRGTVTPRITVRVLLLAAWSTLLVAIFAVQDLALQVGTVAHSIAGVALGLLLVFRTNTAYDRYWEGRKQFGQLVITARNLATRLAAALPLDAVEERRRASALLASYAGAVKEHLRDGVKNEHLTRLTEGDAKGLLRWAHPVNGLRLRLARLIREFQDRDWISGTAELSYDNDLDSLGSALSALERIRFTPMPFAYVNQLKVFMLIYFLTLPIALIPALGWTTVPAMMFIAYTLIGIEEIGVEIEDPFGLDTNDLPLDSMCDGLAGHLDEILLDGTGAA